METATLAAEYLRIPLSQIRPDPTQSRTYFDPGQLEDLKSSLKERGLINPITVRKAGELYEIIAGERRYRAAASLGWQDIDCRVYPPETPALETELLSLVENLQRVDLNPIEEARGYKQLTDPPYNMGQADIAKEVGKTQPVIARALGLLILPKEVQDFIQRWIISVSHGVLLAKITNVEQQIAVAKQAVAEGWTVRDLERHLKSDPTAKVKEASIPKTDPFTFIWPTIHPSVGEWTVTYNVGGWHFHVQVTGPQPQVDLGSWFRGMAVGLGDTSGNVTTQVPASNPSENISVAEDNKPLREFLDNIRVPKNATEQAELENLADQSVHSAFAWVYGAESPVAQQTLEQTWETMGFKSAKQGVDDLVLTVNRLLGARTELGG